MACHGLLSQLKLLKLCSQLQYLCQVVAASITAKIVMCYADPVIVRQITVKEFHRFRNRYMPTMDNPVFQPGVRAAAKSMMLIAKYSPDKACYLRGPA